MCSVDGGKEHAYLTAVPQKGAQLVNIVLRGCQLNTYSSLVLCGLLQHAGEIGTLDISGNAFGQVEYLRLLRELAGRKTKKQTNIVLDAQQLLPNMLAAELPPEQTEGIEELYAQVQDVEGVVFAE